MVTVDVEAQPRRADCDHVDRLIWGKYPEGRAGIGEMMDIADKHGVKLTMFLDYCEEHLYGDSLLDVGREIHRRGHDLQLHAHLDFLSSSFWANRGIAREVSLNKVDAAQSSALFDFLCDRHCSIRGERPAAFRGGGYRYNGAILEAMAKRGVLLDTSVNSSRHTQPIPLPPSKQFLWSNGCLEIPISCVTGYRNTRQSVDFNFNSGSLSSAKAMAEYLDVFYQERGEEAIAALTMHSWSFLRLADKQYFTEIVPSQVEKFEEFLGMIAGKIKTVTSLDIINLHAHGQLSLDPTLNFSQISAKQCPEALRTAPSMPNATSSMPKCEPVGCPICGAEKSSFVDMGGRRCPGCGSLERQRSFAVAYDQAIRHRFDLGGKHVLIFSPSVSERRFLKDRGIAGEKSVDIRPSSKPDIIADVCNMPQIGSRSQECVFASYLMPCVYNMEAALDEIARVLAPDGTFFSIEMLRHGLPTVESKTEADITRWYGKENFDAYKIGSYRTLGENDYLAALEKRFTVVRYEAADPITEQIITVQVCRLCPVTDDTLSVAL